MFLHLWAGPKILQLDCTSFVFNGPIRTVHCDDLCLAMCYVPPPVDALVLCYGHKIVAKCVGRDKVIWDISGKCNDIMFDPEHNVLLAADEIEETVLIVNPENGSLMQTIKLPDMGNIRALGLHKDQIIMLHSKDEWKISYFNLL